jgi:hypothetical protein
MWKIRLCFSVVDVEFVEQFPAGMPGLSLRPDVVG